MTSGLYVTLQQAGSSRGSNVAMHNFFCCTVFRFFVRFPSLFSLWTQCQQKSVHGCVGGGGGATHQPGLGEGVRIRIRKKAGAIGNGAWQNLSNRTVSIKSW